MSPTPNNMATQDTSREFEGGGQMGALIRSYNWDKHPLGNPVQWPESLKTTIRLMLNSAYPMFTWWSRDLYMFHNDPYLPALGKKHPHALGASARVMWAEIWEQIGGIVEDILKGGKPFYAEELLIVLERKAFLEETYWTFSYSATPNDAGGIGGIFCACNEVTSTVLGQRRLKTIKDIADSMAHIQTVEQACHKACEVLTTNAYDIPFSLIYLLQEKGSVANLYGQTGNLPQEAVPADIYLLPETRQATWPLARVLQSRQAIVSDLSLFPDTCLPGGPWTEPSSQAVTLPIFRPGQDQIIGFFISGVSPKLEYNADYRNFHELLAGQIATSIASVQAREEAERKQEDLINLFQQAPVAITIAKGEELIIELANDSMCELWGRTYEEVINKPVFEALPEASGQGLEEILQEVYHTGIPYSASELPVMLNRNGIPKKIYINFVYYPLRDAEGVPFGITAIAVEVSKQVEARQEIEAKNTELMTINADLDNFVYSASHDLKAPILNIEGLMQTLVRHLSAESLESAMVKRLIELIEASVERFKRTVNDLTEVTKIQRGTGEDIALINLPEIITEVCLDLESVIRESDARIETEFLQSPAIRFSAKNIRSIVYNLLSNAMKYRSPDRKLLIHIRTEVAADYMVLSVSDNGLGMDLSDKSKIFSMFKRMHTHVEGSGIGLYIVKKIIENAGGKIEVESQIDQGSTFRVYFRYH